MNGRIFATDPINLAVEGDFYKLVHLNAADVAFIRRFVIDAATHPSAKRMHESLLGLLTRAPRFVDENRHLITNMEEVEAALDTFRTNILEDNHAAVENRFSPLAGHVV